MAAAVPKPRLRLLREALGEHAERIQLLDMGVAGRNPGRIIAEVLRATADAHPSYTPEHIIDQYNRPLPVPAGATIVAFDAAGLCHARRSTTGYAQDAGLDADRVDDVVLVVGELAANSVRHGGGAGWLRTWTEAGHLVCEVQDAGRLDDRLAGRRPADGHQLSGRGLLVVNHLADLVRTHTHPHRTAIRAYFDFPTQPPCLHRANPECVLPAPWLLRLSIPTLLSAPRAAAPVASDHGGSSSKQEPKL